MHLMMDSLDRQPDAAVRASLERAAAFLARQHQPLRNGVWFPHDELEASVESMERGPFKWVKSRALGKSVSNMLVLNTHLDATIALDRYRGLTTDGQHQALVDSACRATRIVLEMRPAEWLYRLMFRLIGLTFLPADEAKRLCYGNAP
jgi:hypothetical protein